jgi:Fe-Mn family superoxide dismutase
MSKYVLPDLPYDYSSLEPFISGKLLELHHTKHHNAYVSGANTAVEQIAEATDKADVSKVNLLTRNYTFNLAGHINHSLFWQNMTAPEKLATGSFINATEGPIGELALKITEKFNSFEKFKKMFQAAAVGVQGSGWAILVYDQITQDLKILQVHDHQAELSLGLTPLVLLDVWEHAYYLDYLNVRDDYITSWWNLIDWHDAESHYQKALQAL